MSEQVQYFRCQWPITIRTKAGRKKIKPDRDKLVRTSDPEVAGALSRAMGAEKLSPALAQEIEARRSMGTRAQPDDVPTSAELARAAPKVGGRGQSMPEERQPSPRETKLPTLAEIEEAGYAFPEKLLAALREGRVPSGEEVAKVGEVPEQPPEGETETTSPGSTAPTGVTGAEVGDVVDEEPAEGETPEKTDTPEGEEQVTAEDVAQMTKAELRGVLVELGADMPASDAKLADLREATLVAIAAAKPVAEPAEAPEGEAEPPAETGGE